MRPVFADTCYWIALLIERDALHGIALRLFNELAHRRIVTSEMVLSELLNSLSRYGAEKRRAAVSLIRSFEHNPNIDVERQTSGQFWAAVDYYSARPDQEWGLVDCSSLQLMQTHNIREALTNDHHFEQAGFSILM